MTLILSGTNGLSDVDGSAATPAIRGTDTNTGIFFPAADTIGFAEGGAEVARFDSSGNLGLGTTTPNTAGYGGAVLGIYGGSNTGGNIWLTSDTTAAGNRAGRIGFGTEGNSTNKEIARVWSLAAGSTAGNLGGDLLFSTKPDGGALTERARIDSSGNFGIGTSSPLDRLDVVSAGPNRSRIRSSVANEAVLLFQNSTTGTSTGDGLYLGIVGAADAYLWNYENNPVIFGANNGERGRFTAQGYFKASNAGTYVSSTGSYHEFRQTDASNQGVVLSCTNGSFASIALQIRADRNTTNDTFYAIRYFNDGAGAYKFNVADSGNVTNTNGSYGTISDAKMKTDIVDAGSQWADIKAIRFRKFKMKDDPTGLVQLGVVAQELEQTSPGLVDEHTDRDGEGNDLGTTTKSVKTSILLMKAAVALQEAMARIEQLEAKVAALESGAK